MNSIKATAAKLSLHGARKPKALDKGDGTQSNDEDTQPVWTTGQEFQFYVPWLWMDSPEPPPDKLHPTRQVVRIAAPRELPGFTVDSMEYYIRHCVSIAVRDLLHDTEMHFTCTEDQSKQGPWNQVMVWYRANVLQNNCDLPAITLPGFDGVLPIEMTMAIKKVSIRRIQGSESTLEWTSLPSPGSCVERVKEKVLIHLTPECSIHIHIRPEKPLLEFNLQAFKKTASILWLAEERLDKLYHPMRITSKTHLHCSLRQYSNLALENTKPLAPGLLNSYGTIWGPMNLAVDEKSKLSVIWQAVDHHELRELLRVHASHGKHGCPAYNFSNLFMVSPKKTIEFRKMESTTDAQVIDAWIESFLLLVNFSMTSTYKEFSYIMESLGKHMQQYNTWHFLQDIGCKRVTIEILRQKYVRQLPSEEQAPRLAPDATTTGRPRRRDVFLNHVAKATEKLAGSYSYSG
ncbi:hypothetical protein diail_6380 [Diaporthe ilicicola]|nr:hypothetical protein diail_6380 [Diaporthe ilicicola]